MRQGQDIGRVLSGQGNPGKVRVVQSIPQFPADIP